MKSIICNNPVMSAVTINIVTLILFIYAISSRAYGFTIFIILVGAVNRTIIDNGLNIDKHKRLIIFISFFLMITFFLAYSTYINNVRNL
ncbi:MAG TPA: hypothetical protein VIM42_09855 [Clostridium sp.]